MKKELELYVHIPFCVRKCAYCDFLSFSKGDQERASYVDALIREIKSKKEQFQDACVTSVFLGGGTPSILKGEETARIFRVLKENFTFLEQAEITMEVNPGTVTEDKINAWKSSGVNRLSIGLQSVNDDELKMLGRIHSFHEFLETWQLVRKAGFTNVNVDLISAIPGQTVESWIKTLTTVADLEPEHLSAYSLIIEEETPFYEKYGNEEGEKLLPDEDTERNIYEVTEQILNARGYHRYEISNYAKDGFECKHNLGYWNRKEYLGLGLGASSLINETRFHNTNNLAEYLSAQWISKTGNEFYEKCSVVKEVQKLSKQEQMEEFMFLGLRKTEGVSEKAFKKAFQADIRSIYGDIIENLIEKGLLQNCADSLFLTKKGVDISNYVMSEFLL